MTWQHNEDDDSNPITSFEKLSRHAFLSRAGAMGVATAAATITAPVAAAAAENASQQSTSPEPAAILDTGAGNVFDQQATI